MPIEFDKNVPLDNKQLRVYDHSGSYIRLSPDELIANRLNYWKDWYCSAGERSLYIDYDGYVWISNCASANYYKNMGNRYQEEWLDYMWEHIGPAPHIEWHNKYTPGGWEFVNNGTNDPNFDYKDTIHYKNFKNYIVKLQESFKLIFESTHNFIENHFGFCGNIYDSIKLPKHWTTCPYDFCGCGADINISKVRESKYITEPKYKYTHLAVSKFKEDGQYRTRNKYSDSIKTPVAVELNFPVPFQILWDLGRRCNYNCNYCWPDVHSTTASHHKYDAIKKYYNSCY